MIKNYGDYIVMELEIDYDFYEDIYHKANEKDIDLENFILQCVYKILYEGD